MSKSAANTARAKTRNTPPPAAAKPGLSRSLKVSIGAGAAILVLGGLVIAAMPGPDTGNPVTGEARASSSSASAGTLTALSTKFNFGSVSMAAGKVTHSYRLRNSGTEPVIIRKMYTSCMCTTAALVKAGRKSDAFGMPGHSPIPTINAPMNPGEEAMIEVVFDPAAHGPAGIGPIERVVTIENSAGRPLELAFAANVRP